MPAKKLIVALLALVAACATRPVTTGTSQGASGGATSAPAAVSAFLGAVRQQDLSTLTLVWGTVNGPVRNTMPREELEMRGAVLMRYLRHDESRVLSESAGTNGQRLFRVELTCGGNRKATTFTTVASAEGRWYVLSTDMDAIGDLCRR